MPLNKYVRHWIYMSHCTSTMVYIVNQHYCTYLLKTMSCIFHLPCYCHICASTNMSLKCHIYAACPNYSVCIKGEFAIYMPHMKHNDHNDLNINDNATARLHFLSWPLATSAKGVGYNYDDMVLRGQTFSIHFFYIYISW